MDILRSQNLARMQGMQHQQLNNQQFPLGSQQMGNMGSGPGNGQPHIQNQSFLDSGSNQTSSSGFSPSLPTSTMQQQQQAATRNAMLQAFQANASQAGHARQLEMLLAQNQPGPINFGQRLEHQRAAQQAQPLQPLGQPSSAELFAPGVDRRPSPGHPNPMGATLNPQQSQPGRKISANELNERINHFRAAIASQERTLAQLGNQRGLTPDAQLLGRMRSMSEEIKTKKEYLAKMVSAMNNFTAMAQAQAQQQANGSGQAAWNFNNAASPMSSGQPQNTPQVGPMGHSSPLARQQVLQQMNRPTPAGPGPIPRPPSVQRSQPPNPTGPLGAPVPGSSFAHQLSPNMNPQFPFPMNAPNGPSPTASVGAVGLQPSLSGGIPPLEKSRFDNAYKSFCSNKKLNLDPRMINFEGRDIDLYMLHTHVMQEGGYQKVQHQDLWSVIGGRMGFVHFAASETEPAKAGPGLAQRLAQVYREYLLNFDQVYITSILESRRKQAVQLRMMQESTAPNNALPNANPAGPSAGQPSRGGLTASQMQMVVGYAHQSVEELRRGGVQERIITFVESNRAYLQRVAMEQGMRSQMGAPGMRPPDQHGSPGAVPPSFQNGSPHLNPAGQGVNFLPSTGMPSAMQGNNFMNNQQPPVPQPPHPNPQNGGVMTHAKVIESIQRMKNEFRNYQASRPPQFIELAPEQRIEFNSIFPQLYNAAQEIEKQLPAYFFVIKSEEFVRRLVMIIQSVGQQRVHLGQPNPRFMIPLENLRIMMSTVQTATERMNMHLRRQMGSSPQQPQQPLLHPAGNMSMANSPSQELPRPPSRPQQSMPPQSVPPPNRATLRPPPVSKKASGQTPVAIVSTPTPPAYSASTPVASAATPTQTASSPPAPVSPKAKPKPKTKQPRRTSKIQPPALPAPEQVPTPSGSSVKRPRDDDVPIASEASPAASGSGIANEPSPPKRPKTESEWGGPPTEAVAKKAEVVENIKTEEDASAFLEQMTELIKMAGEGQEALTSDISETLDQILKGYGSVPDGSDVLLGFSSFGSLGESSTLTSSSKPHPDEFVEFFDFSSFTATDEENDADSKAPTPELSSTGPSPDSGSEADAAQHVLLSTEPKTEELSDLLRLGPWKEIDGGESAYYHSADGWKWDSPMPTLEQPWAIFNS
ncbi:hypothetical protein H0H93_002401 [Arthromyces matolae]|nr:hypothetical protein H0H93_002401 [Arthromyces matolae]